MHRVTSNPGPDHGAAVSRPRIYGDLIRRVSREFACRVRDKSRGSPGVYVRCFANDFYVKMRNKRTWSTRAACPCCGWTGYDFVPFDGKSFWCPRSFCPNCMASERHRLLWLYIERRDRQLLEADGLVLHYAPEASVRALIEGNPGLRSASSDMDPGRLQTVPGPTFQSDILDVPVKNDAVDFLFCLHVLEHLSDDTRAIAELHRILKPGGVAYLMVPLALDTRESVFFGEPNPDVCGHYWQYALDFEKKLASFECQVVRPKSFLSDEEAFRFGVPDAEIVFRCSKPLPHPARPPFKKMGSSTRPVVKDV